MARLIRTIPMSLLLAGPLAGIGYGHDAQAQVTTPTCTTPPTSTCGLRVLPAVGTPEGWFFNVGENVAFVNVLSPLLSIYMDNRGLLGTQTLTVSGTNMAGRYINGSFAGTANIIMVNGATTDLISAGLAGELTNVNITVDGSTLNGAQTGHSMTSRVAATRTSRWAPPFSSIF